MKSLKVDERIRTLIKNGVTARHRSMFVMVGDKWLDRIVDLHYMLSKESVKAQPKVLWCYNAELDLSSHKKKRMRQMKKLTQRGLFDKDQIDPVLRFLDTGITFCKYKDSERILGNSFGMCILQDFEALTPNLLARTIETVEGGGLIILLIRSLASLTSLCTMVKDVHERYRPESVSQAISRFNERLFLSLGSNKNCVVLDDEFNIKPLFSHVESISPIPVQEDSEGLSEAEKELQNVKEQLHGDFPVGPLIKRCCTLDQGTAVLTLLDSILDKTLHSTVALVGARGRGKSSALGLAIAGAVAAGFHTIFVTAPSPKNVKSLFEFVCKGLDVLDYKEYDVIQSTNPEFKNATVLIDIPKHGQKIQYIQPRDHKKLSNVQLLVVDEAAAIPLSVVTSLFGSYHVFLSTTVTGYEASGHSLSLKLLQLEQPTKTVKGAHSGRLFKKIELSEPIRYSSGDPIESWLHSLLCLDVTNTVPKINRLPPPEDCDLYYVDRDTLFSCNRQSELFLQQMMALYVASHYKNSPDDLQLMADSPVHQLFVLLGPVESKKHLPNILCVIQVALEGQIARESAIRSLSDGHCPSGDQINRKFCENFEDTEFFSSLSGARIVRIATHPSAMRLGYGSTAVAHLARYFGGEMTLMSEVGKEDAYEQLKVTEAAKKISLMEESIKSSKDLPNLLVHLHDRRPEKLHYLGVSFGLTEDLSRFWRKHKFGPFHIEPIPSDVTGEHTCMALRSLNSDDIETAEYGDWGFFGLFYRDYKNRFIKFRHISFRLMECKLAMSVLHPTITFNEVGPASSSINEYLISPIHMKKLESYTNKLGDFQKIEDIVEDLARLYFQEKIPVTLSYSQASVLLCMGLQGKDISAVQEEMKLERQQILSLFNKVMKKFYKYLHNAASKEIDSTLPQRKVITMAPHSITIDEDLDEAAREVKETARQVQDGMNEEFFNLEALKEYAIEDNESNLEEALQKIGATPPSFISIKSKGTGRGKKRNEERRSKPFKKRRG